MKSLPFRRHPDADERIASARRAMAAILPLDLYPAHKRELLSICLWKITEAEGPKYRTRYRSEASLSAERRELQHEHVFPRQYLIELLLANSTALDNVVKLAVGCTVTRKEHARLTELGRSRPGLKGWQRYVAAEIRVVDTATGGVLDLAT